MLNITAAQRAAPEPSGGFSRGNRTALREFLKLLGIMDIRIFCCFTGFRETLGMHQNHVPWIEGVRHLFHIRPCSSTRLASRALGLEPLELRLALTGSNVQVADDSIEIMASNVAGDFLSLASSDLATSDSRPPSHVANSQQEAMPDFNLIDYNPTSSTYDQPVSPRDYFGEVSAWYFGHST